MLRTIINIVCTRPSRQCRSSAPRRLGWLRGGCLVIAATTALPDVATAQEAAPPQSSAAIGGVEEVEVTADAPSATDERERSAETVEVMEFGAERTESADLGAVLARTRGVSVRRSGGLGSYARFSLDGLVDDQIRLFLDEVPLELSGFGLGLANVPVDLVERVELYRGVVPVRFGADALGGAVNVVTERTQPESGATAAAEVGSFDTYRIAADGRLFDADCGPWLRTSGFFDDAANDYEVSVEVPDDAGRLSPARVRRFHDAYRAQGGIVEAGVREQPYADTLLARAFVTSYEKELQHNVIMTVPYGEVTYGETAAGGTLRWSKTDLFGGLDSGSRLPFDVALLAGYGYRAIDFDDQSEWVYDWFGHRVRQRTRPGETGDQPSDQTTWENQALGRLDVAWHPDEAQVLRFVATSTFSTRTGEERLLTNPEMRDPLGARRDLLRVVNGLEHTSTWLDDRLENVGFVKQYLAYADAEEILPGNLAVSRSTDEHLFGGGDGIRYRITDGLWTKASYEYATRLPRPDELFGDGVLILPNLDLEPETSHNGNLRLVVDVESETTGRWQAEVGGVARLADDLVVLLGNDRAYTYQNVYSARVLGVDGGVVWSTLDERLELDVNATYQDARNASDRGTFGAFEGDRIPNRPYLFANASARARQPGLFLAGDELSLAWYGRYVHEFYRGWESLGLREFKQVVPSQLTHSLVLGYALAGTPSFTWTFEADNVTDEEVFDFFGVQQPGRAFYFKWTAVL